MLLHSSRSIADPRLLFIFSQLRIVDTVSLSISSANSLPWHSDCVCAVTAVPRLFGPCGQAYFGGVDKQVIGTDYVESINHVSEDLINDCTQREH